MSSHQLTGLHRKVFGTNRKVLESISPSHTLRRWSLSFLSTLPHWCRHIRHGTSCCRDHIQCRTFKYRWKKRKKLNNICTFHRKFSPLLRFVVGSSTNAIKLLLLFWAWLLVLLVCAHTLWTFLDWFHWSFHLFAILRFRLFLLSFESESFHPGNELDITHYEIMMLNATVKSSNSLLLHVLWRFLLLSDAFLFGTNVLDVNRHIGGQFLLNFIL